MHLPLITIIIFLAAVNLITFFLYWLDKHSSRAGWWRLPESTLLGAALIGGTPAAYIARWVFRHKTRKMSFRIKLGLILILQIAAALYFYLK